MCDFILSENQFMSRTKSQDGLEDLFSRPLNFFRIEETWSWEALGRHFRFPLENVIRTGTGRSPVGLRKRRVTSWSAAACTAFFTPRKILRRTFGSIGGIVGAGSSLFPRARAKKTNKCFLLPCFFFLVSTSLYPLPPFYFAQKLKTKKK